MDKKKALLFLDMEFTGVDTNPNQAWEIGWIFDVDGLVVAQRSFYLKHTTAASAWVLKNTIYKKIFSESSSVYVCDIIFALAELYMDLAPYKDTHDIHVIGADVESDYQYLINANKTDTGKSFNLPLHWRVIDLSNAYLGYKWAQGESLAAPIAVVKMMKALGIESSGKRHSVDTDNQDLRNLYYKMFPGNLIS